MNTVGLLSLIPSRESGELPVFTLQTVTLCQFSLTRFDSFATCFNSFEARFDWFPTRFDLFWTCFLRLTGLTRFWKYGRLC